MNFLNFLLTRTLVENRTGNADRANQLGLVTSLMPGNLGLLLGVMLANNEPVPSKTDTRGTTNIASAPARSLPGTTHH